ncbi:MAG: hypothetical protein J3K34DRAFT_510453 [Monoraphidium minutum]|nr:MAG: hypothetical protein J3K34DRAFT_510453 [Monoraphidium minutum]
MLVNSTNRHPCDLQSAPPCLWRAPNTSRSPTSWCKAAAFQIAADPAERGMASQEGGGGGAALAALRAVAAQAELFLCFKPPAMEASWHPEYYRRISAALEEALRRGADPGAAFAPLLLAAADLPDGPPWPLQRRCVAAGLHPDTDVGGGTPLLHYLLARPYPPRLREEGSGGGGGGGDSHPDGGGDGGGGGGGERAAAGAAPHECPVSLEALLDGRHTREGGSGGGAGSGGGKGRGGGKGGGGGGSGSGGATPDLRGPTGATALHVLIGCLEERLHFPARPPRRGGGGGGGQDAAAAQEGEEEEGGEEDAAGARARDVEEMLAESAAGAARARYARAAFAALLAAGFSASARGPRGAGADDLISAARDRAAADLSEARDPRGLPRAALAALVAAEGGGAARLEELAAAHAAGIAEVKAALGAMAAAAAAQRRPRATAAAAALLALWALLLAIAWRALAPAPREQG